MARAGHTRRGALGALAAAGALAACGQRPEAPPFSGQVAFNHGVASGDPGIDRIVIWSRVTPGQTGPVPVRWVLARDRGLTNVVQTGIFETTDARDYTIKIECVNLRSGAAYYYGFLAGDQISPVGRTHTLPTGDLSEMTLAVVCGASHPHGFFNVYDAIADRDDLDVVVCLGDYLFEYGLSGYGGEIGMSLGRLPRPELECLSLADYRLRHAQYKAEAELQRAHAVCPWIVAWDDHEFANRAWSGGAGALNAAQWTARRRAALQAYYEWMPIRDPRPGAPMEAINRNFQFGDLLTLFMLETRLLGRAAPINLAQSMPYYSTPWTFRDPQRPRPVSPAERYPSDVRMLPVPYEEIGDRLVPVWDWARVEPLIANPNNPPAGYRFVPDRDRLRALLDNPSRSLLGAEQETWLNAELQTSHRFGVTWQVIATQGLVAPVQAPDLSALPPEAVSALERIMPGIGRSLYFTRFGMPLAPDGWDSFGAARARLLASLRRVSGNAIVLSGDAGGAFANDLMSADNIRVAVELAAPSVTAPGTGDAYAGARGDFAAAVQRRNPNVRWMDPNHRGFLVVRFEKEQAHVEFMTVSTVGASEYSLSTAAAFNIRPDEAPSVGAPEPVVAEQR